MDAASDLFYRQGYESTVVSQIIGEAGVSKPTFYEHFRTKENLAVEYLRERSATDLSNMKEAIRQEKNPLQRFLTPMKAVKGQMLDADYRGCPYFNMLSEVADPESLIAKEVQVFIRGLYYLIEDVTRDFIASDYGQYGHLDAMAIKNSYYVILGGAITAGQEFRQEWPFDTALKLVENLVR